jgi:hypothetical protein
MSLNFFEQATEISDPYLLVISTLVDGDYAIACSNSTVKCRC